MRLGLRSSLPRCSSTSEPPALWCCDRWPPERICGAPGWAPSCTTDFSPPWKRPSNRVWCSPRCSTPTTTRPIPRHGDPLSRLRFYDRFDALIIDVPYYQPALAPGLQPVYGLLLLALYVRPDLINPARTCSDPPENLLFALRSLLYADGDPDEAAAAKLLAAASVCRVRLVPTSEYAQVTPGLPPAA